MSVRRAGAGCRPIDPLRAVAAGPVDGAYGFTSGRPSVTQSWIPPR
jgi:hypothetical protein